MEAADATAVGMPLSQRDQNALLAHCTIELWATWHNFSRALYLASAFRARDKYGQRISIAGTVPTSEQEAIGIAVQAVNLKRYKAKNGVGPWDWRDEPNWKYPNDLLDAIAALHPSNEATVQGALSTGTRTWLDLPEFRNFFAHRDVETLHKAQALHVHYGHPPTERPGRVLSIPSRTAQGTGWQPLLLDWVDDLMTSVADMTL